jgi:dienelactone hydrolase
MRLFALFLLPAALLAQSPSDLDLILNNLPPSRTNITGRINLMDKSWEEWQRRTGELPPDWKQFRPQPFPPDPLADVDTGARITTPGQWAQQRARIRALYEQWVFGRMPPAPANVRAEVVSETREGELTIRDVVLRFGPNERARLRLQLIIPPGNGPFPVFLTNHPRTRPWVATAVRRGYIGCIYFAADPIYGNDDDSETFLEAYPDYDFSVLARWAWAASRAVDHLVTLPIVNGKQIAITGHSRNGKQALLAAAFDERIGAVSLSSGNTGEGNLWRYTTDAFANESIEQITTNFPHWFHPRFRYFTGREHLLPVDQNLLMAMVAPRGLLLASAYAEGQGAPFGFEHAYHSVRTVYDWLGAPARIGLSLREGEHATTAEDIERYTDFFDSVFGRSAAPPPVDIILGYRYSDWLARAGKAAPPAPAPAAPAAARLAWALGDEPAGVPFPNATEAPKSIRTSAGPLELLYGRPLTIPGARHVPLSFGDDLKADLYLPANAAGASPAVIWLHGYSHATGYSRYARPIFERLAAAGFAVLAFDQLGYGTRIHSMKRFYERYPQWSVMGRMVVDTRAAAGALAALAEIDPARIYLMGSSLGGTVALFTAAREPRIAGIAMLGGFTPLRGVRPEHGAEGIRMYSHLHGLLPRLGAFADRPAEAPIDFDEVLALTAPRPALLIAPEYDRYAPIALVRGAAAGQAHLTLETPADFHRFPIAAIERAIAWLKARAALP